MKTDLSQLVKANFDGLNFLNMGPNSIWWSDLNSVQFVPVGVVLPAKYHTVNNRNDWFRNQVNNWLNQNDYWNPWESGDTIPLQFITNGLSPVTVYVYKCSDSVNPVATIAATLKSSPAITGTQQLWEASVPLSAYSGSLNGSYYLYVTAGAVGAQAKIISEGLWIKDTWPDTILFEFVSSQNKQTIIFDTGYQGAFRVKGFFDNQFKPKYKGAFYTDQPADIEILNAIQYEVGELFIDGGEGVPDYVIRKVAGIVLLDGFKTDGQALSLDEGAEWEPIFTAGSPKKMYKVPIRPASTMNATGAIASGADTDASMIMTTDSSYFGPRDGNVPGDSEIINVTIS